MNRENYERATELFKELEMNQEDIKELESLVEAQEMTNTEYKRPGSLLLS